MKVSVNHNLRLAFDIRRGQWLISDVDALLPTALEFLSHTPLSVEATDFTPISTVMSDSLNGEFASNNSRVVVIPVHGTLTKYDTCAGPGIETIASEMLRFAADKDVVGFVLDIDSGGGACNAIPPMVAAIKKIQAMGKPIVAHCDFCASAAYWIASQCDSIFADNFLSEFGSIGVMTQIVDSRNLTSGEKVITIYAEESKDKNLAYRRALDGDYKLMQDKMSPIVVAFQTAVKDGRKALCADAPGVLSGDTFRCEDAINLGLVDAMLSLDESIDNVFIRSSFK